MFKVIYQFIGLQQNLTFGRIMQADYFLIILLRIGSEAPKIISCFIGILSVRNILSVSTYFLPKDVREIERATNLYAKNLTELLFFLQSTKYKKRY